LVREGVSKEWNDQNELQLYKIHLLLENETTLTVKFLKLSRKRKKKGRIKKAIPKG